MELKERIPDNPLQFIKRCVKERKILWTYHINMRLKDRHISRDSILSSSNNYEILEGYPEDKYLPSYLVYSKYDETLFHILFAVDIKGDNVRIVTAYRPSKEEWEDDFKTRRMVK